VWALTWRDVHCCRGGVRLRREPVELFDNYLEIIKVCTFRQMSPDAVTDHPESQQWKTIKQAVMYCLS